MRSRHCKNELGKGKEFTPKAQFQKYCLETEDCIKAWKESKRI